MSYAIPWCRESSKRTAGKTSASAGQKPANRRTKGVSLDIVVQNASQSDAIPRTERIQTWIEQALGQARSGELTVRIVGEIEGVSLNERFRHGSGATNVLAFPYGESGPAAAEAVPSLGDLVICAPVVEREAAEQGKSLEAHWAHLSVHGTLHLLGYDHDTDEGAQVMEAREREVLAVLGFSDPYGGSS